ncbi:MAG: SPFH domain-containing protein [Acidobacteriota bacterium]
MGQLIEVIEWKNASGEDMVWRFTAGGEIKMGAQLVVAESQSAVFFRDGKALDVFGAGRHTLTTNNIPLLTSLLSLPFGGKSPFRADVYYVNRKTFTNLKWGTREPVMFRDSELAMVRLRAFGIFAVRVVEPSVFVNTLVGTQGKYQTSEVESYLRDVIVSRLNDVLGETMKTILDLPRYYDELGSAMKARVAEDFLKYGLEVTDFFINSITPPEEVQKLIDDRAGMAAVGNMQQYMAFKAAQAMGDAARQPGGNAGAGMGLGMGAGMGMMMPGMIQQAMAGAAAPAAATPAVAPAGTTCPSCQTAIPPGSKFCPGCGQKAPAVAHCTQCGAKLAAGAKFCGECGTKLG